MAVGSDALELSEEVGIQRRQALHLPVVVVVHELGAARRSRAQDNDDISRRPRRHVLLLQDGAARPGFDRTRAGRCFDQLVVGLDDGYESLGFNASFVISPRPIASTRAAHLDAQELD
jgi:hypothetical protein